MKISTMEKFAEVSGISRPTLSKFFNDPNSVRQTTRDRIEAAVEQHNYSPNIFAINQNRRLTKNIGIIVPQLSDPFFAEIVRNIESRCISAGYSPILFSSHGQRELEKDALAALKLLRPTGALVAPLGRATDIETMQAFTKDVPTVLFDSSLDTAPAFVGSDNQQSVALIVNYLCASGEPPCFLQMPLVNDNAVKRQEAYCLAMKAAGHRPEILPVSGEGWNFEEVGFDVGKDLLNQRKLPTNTVLCSNDRLAIGFIAAAYDLGLRVGKGHGAAIRIAGHDDHPWSRFTCPPLTTVRQNYAGIAEQSVEALFELVSADNGQDAPIRKYLSAVLIERASA